jgi:hypothetical protein
MCISNLNGDCTVCFPFIFYIKWYFCTKITDAHVPSDIDSKTIEIITRFEQSLVDTLTSVHKSGKDELSHQLM